jgi:Coenzyme PQQ synthesis protein D (PqqD)
MGRPVKNRTGRPRRRRDGLVVQELPEETLVYDVERHKAHCLEATAAAVWEACDGRRTVEEIAARATKRVGRRVPDEAAWLALRRLGRAKLLEAPVEAPVGEWLTSRRDWLKKAALFGGLSVLSITAPTAAQAATCTPQTTCQGLQNRLCTGAPCCTTGPNPAPPGTICKKIGNQNNCACAP